MACLQELFRTLKLYPRHQTHACKQERKNVMVEVLREGLTAICAPLGFVLGQRLHHILDPPQLFLDLNVPLTWRLCLKTHRDTHPNILFKVNHRVK